MTLAFVSAAVAAFLTRKNACCVCCDTRNGFSGGHFQPWFPPPSPAGRIDIAGHLPYFFPEQSMSKLCM